VSDAKALCILLVDDNRNLLVTLGDYLAFEGFEVMQAESGEEAMIRIEEKKPDLIVLDISMPGMGGLGFLKRISSSNGSLQFPVLVLTARALMEDYFGSLAVDGFLAKPCTEQELVEKIRDILATRGKRKMDGTTDGIRRIILAEDSPSFSAQIARVFRSELRACEVVEVFKGPEVLEKAISNRPELILVKQMLHGMNGTEVLSILRMMPKTCSVPVILYSTDHVMDLDKTRMERGAGGEVRLLPGADPWSLLRAAEEMLTAESPSRAASPPP
jgi:CheY-like chemotaxis protein